MKRLILLFVVLFLTGCSSYSDINNIAVVSSIGIDYKDKNYLVYVNILSSNRLNEKEVYSKKCNDLDKCFEYLNNTLMKRLYLTHLDLLVLGNSLEKDNIVEIFNFFLEQKSSRNSFSVIVVDKIDEKFFEYDTADINNMLDLSLNINGLVKRTTLDNIIKDILNFNLSYIPYLKNNENLEIVGYKSIYSSNKILSIDESLSINLIMNNLNNFSITIGSDSFDLEECNTINSVKNNEVNINISCRYKGESKSDSIKIKNYLNTIINNFIINNNNNYLKYLYYKYKNKVQDELNYKVNVSILELQDNGGEILE